MDWYFAAAEASSSNPRTPLASLILPNPTAADLTHVLTDAPQPPLTEFASFQRLPPELRVVIWEFAMPSARTIELVYTIPDENEIEALNVVDPRILCAKHPDPALLHTNRESRHEFLKSGKWVRSFWSDRTKAFYFNPSIDTLQITPLHLETRHLNLTITREYLNPSKINLVTRLSIFIDISTEINLSTAFMSVVNNFPMLQELRIKHDVSQYKRAGKLDCVGDVMKSWIKILKDYVVNSLLGPNKLTVVEYRNSEGTEMRLKKLEKKILAERDLDKKLRWDG